MDVFNADEVRYGLFTLDVQGTITDGWTTVG